MRQSINNGGHPTSMMLKLPTAIHLLSVRNRSRRRPRPDHQPKEKTHAASHSTAGRSPRATTPSARIFLLTTPSRLWTERRGRAPRSIFIRAHDRASNERPQAASPNATSNRNTITTVRVSRRSRSPHGPGRTGACECGLTTPSAAPYSRAGLRRSTSCSVPARGSPLMSSRDGTRPVDPPPPP